MRFTTLRVLAVAALAAAPSGCIFDQDGARLDLDVVYSEAARDAAPDAPPDARDSSVDSTSDLPDARVDPECVGTPSGSVCRFGASGDASVVGQTGSCINRQFSRARYCFSGAPCNSGSGVCGTSSCVACTKEGDCAGTCSVLFVAGQARQCCVGTSDNGVGTFNTNCSRGDNCKSGLCTSAGHCYTACATGADCPGGNCGSTTVTIGGGKYVQLGCRPGVAGDSSVDASVDGPTPDTTVDAPTPDTTVDAPTPDTTVDAPTPDTTADTTADGPTPDSSVDASVDSSVDGAVDAGAG